ncbi:MAG: amidophosphoribosyltransferase [Bacteroidota bacterium]
MSDPIKHECGIALVRLLKPLDYYIRKYGSPTWGLNKMFLLMQKQQNRGQDGAGLACVKSGVSAGEKYIFRHRSNSNQPIQDIFDRVFEKFYQTEKENPAMLSDAEWLHKNIPFASDLYLGHLRYGTFGKNNIEFCHPLIRQNNWMTRNLVVAGNFNLTNVDELFEILVQKGQHPYEKSDTVTILEKIGSFLDKEVEKTFRTYKDQGLSNIEITQLVAENLNVANVLRESCKRWDGGYAIAGMMGHGDAFVLRDPSGIRPAYYYHDDEVAVVTSERPAIQTAFNIPFEEVHEIKPGHALIIKRNGKITEEECKEPTERMACSFERIYFSRGTDAEIYQERKKLGRLLCPEVLKAIDYDLENSVFSFIPNTAEVAYYGLVAELKSYCNTIKKKRILELGSKMKEAELDSILEIQPRIEKIAVKDVKLRTFITQDTQRDDLVAHVYDITYGAVHAGKDNLVVLDDSIVRGTTLKQSILRMLDRLNPKKIVIVSSAPQIRYPDCYGIDMAKLGDFIAFQAAVELLKENQMESLIYDIYKDAKAQESILKENFENVVKFIYKPFTDEQINQKIISLLKPEGMKADVEIIYQSIDALHKACPDNSGDWYFTGNYPTPGGNRVANRSYINYIEGRDVRAY